MVIWGTFLFGLSSRMGVGSSFGRDILDFSDILSSLASILSTYYR